MVALMQNWVVRKPVAASRGGVVASQNGVAATVGAEILAAGGSAVDAVVAAAFALAVREPWNSGLGGIGFMVVQPPGGARAEIVDFGPIAPAGLDTASYALTGETITELFTWPRVEGDRNMHGPLSFAIPSAVRGYALAVERFGRTPWRDLVAPAVALARAGLPVDWYVTLKTANAAEDLRRYDESRRVWLPDNLPPVFGWVTYLTKVTRPILCAPAQPIGSVDRHGRSAADTSPSWKLAECRRACHPSSIASPAAGEASQSSNTPCWPHRFPLPPRQC